MKKFVDNLDKVLGTIEDVTTAIPLIVFTFILFANVVGRYILLKAIPWAEEASRYLNILMVFMAISAGIPTGAHIGVDAVENLLVPKRFHKYMDALRYFLTGIFTAVTAYLGFGLAAKIGAMKQVSPALLMPMQIPYYFVAVGLVFTTIRCAMQVYRYLTAPKEEETKEVTEA